MSIFLFNFFVCFYQGVKSKGATMKISKDTKQFFNDTEVHDILYFLDKAWRMNYSAHYLFSNLDAV